MARSTALPSLGLSPFGSGGQSFDAFSVASRSERAYLEFRKVEIQWENGQIDNDTYLAAMRTYAGKLKAGSSEKLNAEQRINETLYRFDRQAITIGIEKGTKTWDDLLAFDKAKVADLNPNSAEYQSRLETMRSTQNEIFNRAEEEMTERYQDGKMTTAQLLSWYEEQLGGITDNPDLKEALTKRIGDAQDRAVDERDQKMIKDFSDGKVSSSSFLAYATAAQSRYVKGTAEYDDWADRIEGARDEGIESSLLYRYGLTTKYAELEKFVKDYGTAPTGGTSTSTSTRVVLGADGQWKTVKSTSTKAYGPSKSEQEAWAKRKVEVASAKAQMKQIEKQLNGLTGGWVSTDDMIRYYSKVQQRYVKGTSDWYNVQERLDGLKQQKAAESVLRQQGIKITYPKVKNEAAEYGSPGWADPSAPKPAAAAATPKASTKAPTSIDQFMKAIASVESGGRYNAVNKSTGAYGKYQIMPSNWAGWARKYLGDANARMTPENQEKVARGKMLDLYKWLGSWEGVAHWWLSGGSDKAFHNDPSRWSAAGKSYVDKVMGKLGASPTKVASGGTGGSSYSFPGTGSGTATGPAGGGGVSPASIARGAATTTAPKAGAKPPAQSERDGAWLMRQLNFPAGLDGRAFEKFYSRFIRAFEEGEEVFVDYSSGRAVSYFIPTDIDLRAVLVEELDDLRIAYYVERAGAYAGTSSGYVAANNASDAVKDAATNQIKILDMILPEKEQETTWKKTEVAGKERVYEPGSRGTQTTPEAAIGRVSTTPNQAAAASNAIAAGQRLAAKTEAALGQYAALAQAALKRGDLEAAYGYTQLAEDLIAHNQPIIAVYEGSAKARLAALTGAGGKVDAGTTNDLEDLGEALSGDLFAKPLADLQDVAKEIHTYIEIDPSTDEPRTLVTGGDEDTFVLKKGVVRSLGPNGEVKFEQRGVTGFGADATKGEVTINVKIGNTYRQVQAKYRIAQIGSTPDGKPVYGKIVSGWYNDKQYTWVENPLKPGTWMSATNVGQQGVAFKVPTGSKTVELKPGSGDYQYEFKAKDGKTYRVAFDQRDGVAKVYRLKTGLFGVGGDEWEEYSPAEGQPSTNDLLSQAGWDVDRSVFRGDDKDWTDTEGGPWVGTTKAQRDQYLANTRTAGGGTWTGRPQPSMSARLMAAAKFNSSQRNIDLLDQPAGAKKPTEPAAIPSYLQRDSWYADEERAKRTATEVAQSRLSTALTLGARTTTGERNIDKIDERVNPTPKIKPVAKPPTVNRKTGVAITGAKKKVVTRPKKVVKPAPVPKPAAPTYRPRAL